MHTQKDLVSSSTQVWAREERKASLGSWVNRLSFFPSWEHCFTVTFWQYWTDTTSSDQTDVFYAAITHGHRRLGFPATGWVTWLKHRAASEAEGTSWSPDQKLCSQICALVSPPVIRMGTKVDVASWILYSRFITTVGFKLVIWILEVQFDAFQMYAKVGSVLSLRVCLGNSSYCPQILTCYHIL